MSKYIVSIVIPTKNRQKYCLAAVEQILSLENKSIQICIQDNSDSNELENELNNIDCSNIIYHYNSGVLSFVDNFSEAISLAEGDYVCMIGDDDGILPNIVGLAQNMALKNIDAAIPGLNSVYYWPSKNPIHKDDGNGLLVLNTIKNIEEVVEPHKAMISLLKNGSLDYVNFDLPRVYHGLVKREVFERILKKTGKLFDGLTPDIYMAGALSFVCKKVIRTQYPITVSGICPTSGSADSAKGRHTGELKDAPHFRGHDNYNWERMIPYIYSVETIWAETLLKVLHNFGAENLLEFFNLRKLVYTCDYKYPQFHNRLENFAKEHNFKLLEKREKKRIFKKISFFCCKLIRLFKYGRTRTNYIYNVENINKAVDQTYSCFK